MTEEQWRPVVGYEGLYEVSDHGRVKATRRKGSAGGLRKLQTAKCGGYLIVSLGRDGRQVTRSVHSLVMKAFVGPCPEGLEVRHLDGDPSNPHLSNLRYGTSSENKRDMLRHGSHFNAALTHCREGHPFDEANTYINTVTGGRQCRACRRRTGLEWWRRTYGPASKLK